MKRAFYFKEVQKFPLWVRISVILISLFTLTMTILNSFEKEESGKQILLIFVILFIILLVNWIVQYFEIDSSSDKDSFKVVVKPFGINKEFIYTDLRTVEYYNYKSWKRFPGGWGIRYALSGNTFYNANGFDGILFKTDAGKTYVIGTQKKEAAIDLANQWKTSYGEQ